MPISTRVFAAAALLSSLLAGAAGAQSHAVSGGLRMGPLNEVVRPGVDAVWTVGIDRGDLLLENRTGEGDIFYYNTSVDERNVDTLGRRLIGVDVAIESGGQNSRAGLLYGLEPEPRGYYMYTLGTDGHVHFEYIEGGRRDELVSLRPTNLRPGLNRLSIREDGQTVVLMVNETPVQELTSPRLGRGAPGVVGWYPGRYRYTGFSIVAAGAPASAGPAIDPGGREPAFPALGPLADAITPGLDGRWRVEPDGAGGALLETSAEGALRYYYIDRADLVPGRREASAEVEVLSGAWDSAVGLLYGYEDTPESYFVYVLGGAGDVSLHFIGEQGLETMSRVSLDAIRPGPNRLSIREIGGQIELSVNGRVHTTIGNGRMGRGAFGIVAWSAGRYRVGGFSLGSAR